MKFPKNPFTEFVKEAARNDLQNLIRCEIKLRETHKFLLSKGYESEAKNVKDVIEYLERAEEHMKKMAGMK